MNSYMQDLHISKPHSAGERLGEFIWRHRFRIVKLWTEFFSSSSLPPVDYWTFIKSPVGQKRLLVYIRLLVGGLFGQSQKFYQDQRITAYQRARMGFGAEGLLVITANFKKAVWACLRERHHYDRGAVVELILDLEALDGILDSSRTYVALGYMDYHHDCIARQARYLQKLNSLITQVTSSFEMDLIFDTVVAQIRDILGVQTTGVCVLESSGMKVVGSDIVPTARQSNNIWKYLQKTPSQVKAVATYLQKGNRKVRRVLITCRIPCLGNSIGFIYIGDVPSRMVIKAEEASVLEGIARATGQAIANVQLVNELKEQQLALQHLVGRNIALNEEESRRISREIHDSLAQTLSGVLFQMEVLEHLVRAGGQDILKQVQIVRQRLDTATTEVRRLIRDLRPPILDDLGLAAALQTCVEAFQTDHSVSVDLLINGNEGMLSTSMTLGLYRICQEALANVRKHSRATTVKVSLRITEQEVVMSVADNGIGMDADKNMYKLATVGHYGILGMKERAESLGGVLDIRGSVGCGTEIIVRCPSDFDDQGRKDDGHSCCYY